jgi:type IV pilus assembly protein PilB
MMVGEIRCEETAEIALQAAQTGHLVLSTLHTNNAREAYSRLINLGIPQYHLSSVSLVIAQRLVRKLCPYCKQPHHYAENFLKEIDFISSQNEESIFYKALGCEKCHLGYKGRMGIFEMLSNFDESPLPSLREAGFLKVKLGLTSLEEVLRVTG